jgi:hypothetical protein
MRRGEDMIVAGAHRPAPMISSDIGDDPRFAELDLASMRFAR